MNLSPLCLHGFPGWPRPTCHALCIVRSHWGAAHTKNPHFIRHPSTIMLDIITSDVKLSQLFHTTPSVTVFPPLHLLTSETHGQQQPIRQLELLEEGLVSEEVDLKTVETTFEHIHAHPLMLQRYYLTKNSEMRHLTYQERKGLFWAAWGPWTWRTRFLQVQLGTDQREKPALPCEDVHTIFVTYFESKGITRVPSTKAVL